MSDFLVNLVRRGAGLAPMVRSRPAPPAADADSALSDSDRSDGEVSPLETSQPQLTQAAIPSAPPVMASPATHGRPPAPLLSQPIAATAAPIVQRIALPTMPAPPAAPAPLRPGESAAAVTTPREADPIVVGDPSPRWSLPLTGSVAPGESSKDDHAAPVDQPGSPESAVSLRPAAPATPELRHIDRLITNTQLIEVTRDAGGAIADISPSSPAPPPSHVESPAPAPLPTRVERPAPDALALPERVVHVRIGAIEIHGAAAPVAAPPAAPSPPPPLVTSSDIAFDRYARLRSYAPLNW